MRQIRRLLDTTTFRLALVYLALFWLCSLALIGYIYWATTGVIERQITATIDAEIQGLVEQYRAQGLGRLRAVIERRSALNPNRASIYLLAAPSGRRITGNLERWPRLPTGEGGWLTFSVGVRAGDGDEEIRRAQARLFLLEDGVRLLVGREVEDRLHLQALIRRALLAGLGLTVVLGLAGGYLSSRGLLRQVDSISRTTGRIIAGDLAQRIEVRGTRDEFDRLAANLNAMLEQIERLLEGMRQVTDNIAHDLRTPLTRMRSRIEVALLGDVDQDGARQVLEDTLADADALIRTFNALLAIARAEAGSERVAFEEMDLEALICGVVDLYAPLAEDKGVDLKCRPTTGLQVRGHPELLAQALSNLVDNAIKYTPGGGGIRVGSGTRETGAIELVVEDTGPGVPAADRERITERFVRLEDHRKSPGIGLGLSMVRAIARLHGAKLVLEDAGVTDSRPCQPDGGTAGLRVALQFAVGRTAERSAARYAQGEGRA